MNTLSKLYAVKKWQKKIDLQAKIKGYSDTFDIDLTDNKGIADCCIGHFGYNFYFRTPLGLKEKRYKSWKSLANAIKKVAKNNGIEVESIGIKRGYKYRALNI